jgi:hypothetical protein
LRLVAVLPGGIVGLFGRVAPGFFGFLLLSAIDRLA